MDLSIREVRPTQPEVARLIEALNTYQIGLYGPHYCHLDPPGQLEAEGAYMLGAWVDGELAGMGALKFRGDSAEIKRMFVNPSSRRLGLAQRILSGLEEEARTRGISRIFLETGIRHYAAMQFYARSGYQLTQAFGPYRENGISVFMRKTIH